MQLRRKFAIAVCATALTAPVLSSCGFNLATDEIYDPAAGTNSHEGAVDVLGAVVVAGQDDSGTLVAGLANNENTEAVSLTAVAGEDATADFEPIEVVGNGFVNLADEEVHVTGSFGAGDVLDLTLEFDNGDQVALEVPVVTNCDEFEGYDTSAEGAEASEDPAYSCEHAESEAGH
jgi:copper(I)-binding protein